MSIVPAKSKVPVVPVAAGAVVAQFADDVVHLLLPLPLLGTLSGLIAILLTAGAARVITRGRTAPAVARTGLAVGATSQCSACSSAASGWWPSSSRASPWSPVSPER